MNFSVLRRYIPKKLKCRKYIENKLEHLDYLAGQLRLKSGNCDLDYRIFKDNRRRLVKELRKSYPNSLVLLRGNNELVTPCVGKCFVQDSFFYWAFGVPEPGWWGAIDVNTGKSYLIYPVIKTGEKNVPESDKELIKKTYEVHHVITFLEMKMELLKLGTDYCLVLDSMDQKWFDTVTKDGVYSFVESCNLWLCNTVLTKAMCDCRAIKSGREYCIIRAAAQLNNEAIKFLMYHLEAGLSGYCVSALFTVYVRSCLPTATAARTPICLSGPRALCTDPHYAQLYQGLPLKQGDICVLDMGVALHNYRTNIVTTIPIGVTFSKEQGVVHTIVMKIRKVMLEALGPGIKISDLEIIAFNEMTENLLYYDILNKELKKKLEPDLNDLFFPNGIGHFLGIDLYDCSGKMINNNEKGDSGIILKPGMIWSLNSELYINGQAIIDRLKTYYHEELKPIERYFGLVVRIQDIIVITSGSYELLSDVPRSSNEIAAAMVGNDEIKVKICINQEQRQTLKEFPMDYTTRSISSSEYKCVIPALLKNPHLIDPSYKKFIEKSKCAQKKFERKMNGILNTWMDLQEQPCKEWNVLLRKIYDSPYKGNNLSDVISTFFYPDMCRPQLIPYPRGSFLSKSKQSYKPYTYGCPYFDWHEDIPSTCDESPISCVTSPPDTDSDDLKYIMSNELQPSFRKMLHEKKEKKENDD